MQQAISPDPPVLTSGSLGADMEKCPKTRPSETGQLAEPFVTSEVNTKTALQPTCAGLPEPTQLPISSPSTHPQSP